ncbi:Co-chaperone [Basidiobolus ranarum]|uniref:Co-chaperone n=1 Tax=Basidiobolus ranarum TaxID=34480 RepID=A0ABR2WX69_9FUNG
MTTMANWKNVNNWHWTEKNCAPWAKEYFTRELKDLEAQENGITVKTTAVSKVTGDVDLNQRKGKIITLYDLSLTLDWSGTSEDGTEAKGKILIPEVAHDSELDDYVFEVSIDEETREKRVIKEVVRLKLTQVIRKKLALFTHDLIEAHAKDVYIEAAELRTSSPAPVAPAVTEAPVKASLSNSATENKSAVNKPHKVNTTTMKDTIEFVASAHDIYETLLDQNRVSVWTRGSAKISKEINSQFELFGGNISGQIIEAVQDKRIVMKWRSKTWPEDHYSKVTIELDQGSDGVKLQLVQEGVPLGQEDITRGNWKQYYWNPIKTTFGFGAFI